jgi:hypothetical protein
VPETESKTRSEIIEEVIWSGFPEGHVALRNPRQLAQIVDEFIVEQDRSLADLATNSIAINHVAYRMARPEERLDDPVVESYCDLAEYIFRALALAE